MSEGKEIVSSDEYDPLGRNFGERKSADIYFEIWKGGRKPSYVEIAGILKKDYEIEVDEKKVRYWLTQDRGGDGSNRTREELVKRMDEYLRAKGWDENRIVNEHVDIIEGKKVLSALQMESLRELRHLAEMRIGKGSGVQINQQFILTQRGGEE